MEVIELKSGTIREANLEDRERLHTIRAGPSKQWQVAINMKSGKVKPSSF